MLFIPRAYAVRLKHINSFMSLTTESWLKLRTNLSKKRKAKKVDNNVV